MGLLFGRISARWRADGGYGRLLAVAVPLILSNGAFSIQQFIDRVFLAWYSPDAIAASAPSGMFNFMILSLFINTAAYAGTFVAQYHGAGRDDRVGPAIWQSLYLSVAGGALMLLLVPAAAPIFHLVGHAPGVERDEIVYFRILCAGSFFPIANAALSAFYSGLGKTWPIMWINFGITGLNVILDYLLIFGALGAPAMGIAGAAIATVAATACGTVALLLSVLLGRGHSLYRIRRPSVDADLLRRMVRYGLPSGLQVMIDMTGFTIFILLVGRLGTDELAATNIALNINMLAFMPIIGLGIAVSVVVGQEIGRGSVRLAEQSAYSGVHLALVYMICIGAMYLLLPGLFLLPYTVNAAPAAYGSIARTARVLLRFVALYSLFDALNITFSSAIKGAGDTRFVVWVTTILSLSLLTIPTLLIVFVFRLNIYAAWAAATFYITMLGVVYFLRFRGGAWKRMRVIEPRLEDASMGSG